MKAQWAPIRLTNFYVVKSIYELVMPVSKKFPKDELFREYDIDIDFGVHTETEKSATVYMKMAINRGETHKPGYSLFIEGAGTFTFESEETLTSEQKNKYLYYSGIAIVLGNLRGALISITGMGPLGKYVLPSIDVEALIKMKNIGPQ